MNQLQYKLHLINEYNMMEEDVDQKLYNQHYYKNPMDHQYHNMKTKNKLQNKFIINQLILTCL